MGAAAIMPAITVGYPDAEFMAGIAQGNHVAADGAADRVGADTAAGIGGVGSGLHSAAASTGTAVATGGADPAAVCVVALGRYHGISADTADRLRTTGGNIGRHMGLRIGLYQAARIGAHDHMTAGVDVVISTGAGKVMLQPGGT